MNSDLRSMELPAFELDCRDWLIARPDDGCAPDEVGGAPVVAMLSTVVIGDTDLVSGSAMLSVGLLDDETAELASSPDAALIDVDDEDGSALYVVPAPGGQLALLAEFSCDRSDVELMRRFDTLMSSFRWAS